MSVFAIGCESDDANVVQPQQQQPPENENPEPNEPTQPVAVAFEEASSGFFQNYGSMFILSPGNYVLNSATEWNAFLTYPHVNHMASIDVVPDFTVYTYIAVRHGFHSGLNDDVKIYIQSIVQLENTITVKFVKTDLIPGTAVLTIEGQPYQIVRIPHTTASIVFEQVNE